MTTCDDFVLDRLRKVNRLLADLSPDALIAAEQELSAISPEHARDAMRLLDSTRELAAKANQFWERLAVREPASASNPLTATRAEYNWVG